MTRDYVERIHEFIKMSDWSQTHPLASASSNGRSLHSYRARKTVSRVQFLYITCTNVIAGLYVCERAISLSAQVCKYNIRSTHTYITF